MEHNHPWSVLTTLHWPKIGIPYEDTEKLCRRLVGMLTRSKYR